MFADRITFRVLFHLFIKAIVPSLCFLLKFTSSEAPEIYPNP
jgi:hypothetical protein